MAFDETVSLEDRHREGVELSSLGYYEHAQTVLFEARARAIETGNTLQTIGAHRDLGLNALRMGRPGTARVWVAFAMMDLDEANPPLLPVDRANERGANLTAIGRVNTFEGRREAARQNYYDARRILTFGNNTYFKTSNNILAAREAKLAGRHLAALGLAALAFSGVVEATLFDKPNRKRAFGTFAGRLPDTFSKKRASASLHRSTPIFGHIFNV